MKGFANIVGIGPKGKDVKGLLINSVKILGRDKDIFMPAVYMTLVKAVNILLVYYAIYTIVLTKNGGRAILFFLGLIVLGPIATYISIRLKAITCWMVYDILRGVDTDMAAGSKGIKGNGLAIFLFACVDHAVASANSNKSDEKGGGVLAFVGAILLSLLKEVWDLVKNFSLPAIVIEKVSFKELPDKLKAVKKNVPATLIGVLGIDLLGGVIGSLMGTIVLPAVIVAGVIGFYGKGFLPSEWLVKIPFDTNLVINMLLLFFVAILGSIFTSFINSVVHLVKTSYFTTFYLSLMRPDEIIPELREDVTEYLDYNERLGGYTFFERSNSKTEEAYDLEPESGEDLKVLNKLTNTFRNNMAKGISAKKIGAALTKKGYPKEQIQKAYKLSKS